MRDETVRVLAVAVLVAAFGSVACGKRFSIGSPPAPTVLSKSSYAIDAYGVDFGNYSCASGDSKTKTADCAADTAKARTYRDKIVYSLMAEIDESYGEYTSKLFSGKGIIGVSGDSAILGLTAASTIATHTPTKTILSALGTAFAGVNLSVDKNFFAQQTFQAIAIAMQTRRDKAREQITNQLKKGVDEYPLAAARRDLVAYFFAGTLPGGLQELQEEAGAAAKQQSAEKTPAIH